MSFTIQVRMKRIGKQKKEDLRPVPFVLERKPETVKELLVLLTRLLVQEYNARKDEGQLVKYLTREEIKEKASAGKVSFGLRGGEDGDPEAAAENALQCFADGIYRVFYGEEELEKIDGEIPWKDGEVFTFMRLTMLSGW
ncbi:MAG: hypothetical protein HFG22_15800 [Lachnospiraceae bacterium]|nr:hypothetical protein [Lachnospiraceae bacterium]